MSSSELELLTEPELIDELLRRFEHGVFIAVKPPQRTDGVPEFARICKWGSAEIMAFHCRAFAAAVERITSDHIKEILAGEEEEE